MKKFSIVLVLFFLSFQVTATPKTDLLPDERDTITIFEKTAPLVVNVHKLRTVITRDLVRHDVQAGTASGFIWDKNGYIVTNFHVIRGANKIAVTLQKGKTVQAKIIGAYPRKDIALLKIADTSALKDLDHFEHFPVADSNDLQVGQNAIAIGNPFGLDSTLTTGVVSALGREIPGVAGRIHNMIQTDASINPGNSGGPLLDSHGRLIGMNTMIFSASGTSSGIGFAVPANDINRIVKQLIQYGRVKQARIGVQVFNDQVARQLGLEGVIISSVITGSPAQKAGLQGSYRDRNGDIILGDIISAINNHPIKRYDDLFEVLDHIKVGDTVTIKYLRNGHSYEGKVKTIDI